MIQVFDVIDSTSEEVRRQLREKAPPFAVVARQQSKGRGRFGHEWQSEGDNIYLSVALPFREQPSLVAAVLIHQWVVREWGIHFRLKWPNDLFFEAKKLGGILCESSVQGTQFGPVIVGVGINVNEAPAVDQRTIALKDILHESRKIDPVPAATSLATFLVQQWLGLRQPLEIMEQVMYPPGTLLVSNQRVLGLNDAGELRLMGLDGSESVVGTAAHGLSPKIVDPSQRKIWIIEVGNSTTKLYRFVGDSMTPVFSASTTHLSEEQLDGWGLGGGDDVYLCGVQPQIMGHIKDLLAPRQVNLVPQRLVRLRSSDYDFSRIGFDRVAAMEGALQREMSPCIVVSCGTAITIDAVDDNRVHVGGWILPGVRSSLLAMHEQTAKLPLIEELSCDDQIFGKNTRSAMLNGVRQMIRAAIFRASSELRRQCREEPRVLVTGGDAEWIAEASMVVDKDLIARGCLQMIL